jgi:hypothetical protein
MLPDPVLDQLSSFGRVARALRRALREALARGGERLPGDAPRTVDDALTHLGRVREGFTMTLRTADIDDPAEFRALVNAILVDWSFLTEAGIRRTPAAPDIERPLLEVVAFAHAATVFRVLPRLAGSDVSYPGPPGYADVPVPRTPGEMLTRIEEVERVVARGAERPLRGLHPEPVRRTLGFFDASAWLLGRHGFGGVA